jgi:NAD-dependent SIR2 family protein deacetylase
MANADRKEKSQAGFLIVPFWESAKAKKSRSANAHSGYSGMNQDETVFHQAANAIQDADGLLIGAGAGMGVDSGLPDFRGPEGFWRAYPLFRERGLAFEDVANPRWFVEDPAQAWGFYGHRRNLYRATRPHAGFEILKRWGEQCPLGYFVFTSNVDGHFQAASFDPERIVECHGSLEHLQCVRPCGASIWPSEETAIDVDERTFRAAEPLPRCRECGGLARPNVLMFGDWYWVGDRTAEQIRRYRSWLSCLRGKNLVAIELGAGTAVPTVRYECQNRATRLIRINLREDEVPRGHISLAYGALEGLNQIARLVRRAEQK